MHRSRLVLAGAVLAVAVLAGCGDGGPSPSNVTGGDAGLGEEAMVRHGCGSCHTIPGVKGADALVAPPLVHFGKRSYIAGQLANTPANLVRWILDPDEVEPGTDMPDLDVTEEEAQNIAAYLEGLD